MGSFKFKIIVLGDKTKSAVLKKYLHSCFNKDYSNVIGCNIFIRYENLDFDELTFSIWDISSNERFKFFRTSFYHGSCATLIFINLNDPNGLREIPEWATEASRILENTPIFLIGYNLDSNQNNIEEQSIEDLCLQYNCRYYEIDETPNCFNILFRDIATITLNNIGYTEEKRRELNNKLISQNKEFRKILNNLGFNVIADKKIEILTSKGIFTVDIINGKVYYEHYICEKCDKRKKCQNKIKDYNVKKSLCIVRKESAGWSNVLNSSQLLILSKIFAIMEDRLPDHVINQMRSSIHCEYGKLIFCQILNNLDKDVEVKNEELISHYQKRAIKTKLRNLQNQFWEGSIPSDIYHTLKEKYLNLLDSDEVDDEVEYN